MPDMPLWALEYIPYLGTISWDASLGRSPDGMKSCQLWIGSSSGWCLGTLNSWCQGNQQVIKWITILAGGGMDAITKWEEECIWWPDNTFGYCWVLLYLHFYSKWTSAVTLIWEVMVTREGISLHRGKDLVHITSYVCKPTRGASCGWE